MAEYTERLNLFKPGTDDNVGVESSLDDNFTKIDTKLGDMLKDLNGKEFDSAGARMNEYQKSLLASQTDINLLKKKSPNERLDNHFFRSIAHRGASGTAPENTLAAFAYAVQMGFWGIETDIQLSSDGAWVCCHDETIDRTSNGTGAISSKTVANLKTFDFGSWYSPVFANERIPTLWEYLEICRLGNVVPYIEVKKTDPYTDVQLQGLVNTIRSFDMEDVAVVISFTYANLQKIRYYSDFLALGYVSSTFTQQAVDRTAALGNAFLDVSKNEITADTMKLAKAKNIQVEAYTVDSNRQARSLAKLGVRGITTNEIPYARGF